MRPKARISAREAAVSMDCRGGVFTAGHQHKNKICRCVFTNYPRARPNHKRCSCDNFVKLCIHSSLSNARSRRCISCFWVERRLDRAATNNREESLQASAVDKSGQFLNFGLIQIQLRHFGPAANRLRICEEFFKIRFRKAPSRQVGAMWTQASGTTGMARYAALGDK